MTRVHYRMKMTYGLLAPALRCLQMSEIVLDNSIWATGYYLDYWGNIGQVTPKRFIDGEWVAYYAPGGWRGKLSKLFLLSERRTWFIIE